MPSLKKVLRKAAKAKKRKEGVGNASAIPDNRPLKEQLVEHGVPKRLSNQFHNAIKGSTSIEQQNLKTSIANALAQKKKDVISEEGLTTVVEEILDELEHGLSTNELQDLAKEIIKSEAEKHYSFKTHIPQTVLKSSDGQSVKVLMPLPSIGEGGVIKKVNAPGLEWSGEDLSKVNKTYPLIFKNGKVHVYANIRFDSSTQGLIYRIIEPQLTKDEKAILNRIESALIEELEVDFAALKIQTAEKYLAQKVDEIITYFDMKMSDRVRQLIDYYISRDFIGLSKIEPMFQDPNIEDISCDGVGIPIYIYHRDPRFGSIKTNIVYSSDQDLNSFVMKLAQRCGRSISVADPLLDGALSDGSRVQATFGSGIAMKGSNFTIRKFTKDPMTFIDILNYKTANSEILAYLWLAIEHGKSILIAGPTASGKTTLLNALSLFIRPELKVVSIEDTPELRMPHENWISQVARTGFGPEQSSGKKIGEITLFDLLKASLRQRPDNIVVGEVRGKEAYVLFQQMATGHPGMSTIHADSLQAVISRLRTPPIELPPSLIQHLDILIVLTRQRMRGRYVRRMKEIVEIMGYDLENDRPESNTAYTWIPSSDIYKYTGRSSILKGIIDIIGSTPEGMYLEVKRRMEVIEWMHAQGLRDYKNIVRVIWEYYQNPNELLEQIHQ